jgi:membrane protein involved in colicin uptake
LIGCFLLLSGWLIVIAALLMLSSFAERMAFAASGLAVEVLGLVLLTRGYMATQRNAG